MRYEAFSFDPLTHEQTCEIISGRVGRKEREVIYEFPFLLVVLVSIVQD